MGLGQSYLFAHNIDRAGLEKSFQASFGGHRDVNRVRTDVDPPKPASILACAVVCMRVGARVVSNNKIHELAPEGIVPAGRMRG